MGGIEQSYSPFRPLDKPKRMRTHHNLRILLIVAVCCTVLLVRRTGISQTPNSHGLLPTKAIVSPRDQAANSTLGFEKILTVAYKQNNWRTRGLRAAASITNLNIDVPEQPYITDEEVNDFLAHSSEPHRNEKGTARVWMAHRDMLKHIIMSSFSTALILEDDADWDMNIHIQSALLSSAIRNLTDTKADDNSPYGSEWEVLWLGHSGDQSFNTATPHVEYADPTILPFKTYAWWTKAFLEQYNRAGHRSVQWPIEPTGLIAYAVNTGVAQKILRHLGEGGHQAIDLELRYLCQYHILRCFIVNPEIVGMYEPKAELGYVSPNNEGNGQTLSKVDEAFEKVKGATRNVKDSARCAALFGSTCQPTVSEA
ncbi:hypothetical protein LTS08_006653 [Lithohypha guttulata]|uniref:Glycosyltransferase family 25 protein n=1 Tax=Lithohypha guttulata TaxID=1690604 RepID=A0AAN7SY40_9EURO|nr:hypothetical protein LTR51_008030 [Lithohypha guttulata]KAK5084576.1 hypothetical protein LTR05_005654 [Lithohypha guttulata]KAK5097898.1 hypothetical protein LTS08_006653 [Lithohypha guttulata]